MSASRSIRFICLLLAFWAVQVFGQAATPLHMGIMPFNSPVTLLKTHQPLIRHVEASLGRAVVVNTSSDYTTFVNQLLDGQFDIAIAGPHFASMAKARGATLLVRYKAELQPVFVVRQDSTIRSPDDLRGTRIGLSSPLSMSSIGGVKWLQDQGLVLGKDFRVRDYTSHGAAIAAVAVGDIDAVLTTHTPLRQVPEDIRNKTRVLPSELRTPHLITVASAKLGHRETMRLRQALLAFERTPAGEAFFRETGYLGYSEVSAADLQSLKPFVELTVDMMRLRP